MFVFLLNTLLQNTMAEQNVPTQPPTRTDEQIVPRSQWLTIGVIHRENKKLLFNAQKIQKNPIFQISVDILSNTNFFQAFMPSANCQVDEQWFDLSADLLRKALAITPVIPAHPFELPPSGNTVIDFVIEAGKTSCSDKPRHNIVLQMYGNVTSTNVCSCRADMEGFYTQGIQTFFSHKASHKASLKDPKKKSNSSPHSLWTVFQGDEFGNHIRKRVEGEDDDAGTWNDCIKLAWISLSATRRDQTPHDSTTGPSSQPEDDTAEKVIHDDIYIQ
ncbi:hypothetical protein Tco_1289284 [Tanacetum coccineum]